MKTGAELIAEINATEVQVGDAVFWWLGQLSSVVKTHEDTLYFDPFLSPHPRRQVPSLLQPHEVTNATLVFGTHDHRDHIDHEALPGIAAASPQARFVMPTALQGVIEGLGIAQDRIVALNADEDWASPGTRITAIPAAHEFFHRTEDGLYPFLGYIVRSGGVCIYHSGDTLRYEGLETRLKEAAPDLMFLPINGRDAVRLARGTIGNMTYQEAVDLAGAVRPRLTVPGHYEMFANNGEDPQLFAEYMRVKFPGVGFWIGEHGTPVRLSEN